MNPDRAGRMSVSARESVIANRRWWDAEANDYMHEHGNFLGDTDFVWGPEGWRESELNILGGLEGKRVLEFGGGAGQAGRWCVTQGAHVISTDLSGGMLREAKRLNTDCDVTMPLVQCDAGALPFAEGSFDLAFSAFGAVPFIADTAGLMAELYRVLVPGGILVFSTTHPIRWAFPDVPTEAGLLAQHSYFDTTPYAEAAGSQVTYAEHHRTLEARVSELLGAGFTLTALRELPWKSANTETWGGWSPQRGAIIPGTLILVGQKP